VSTTLDQHLKRQGLLPSTRKKYTEILATAPKNDLVGWIHQRVHARTPIGTLLPMRAAVKHYLILQGYSEEEASESLPKAKGRAATIRHALNSHQLACYHAAVEQVDVEPAHIILTLLPLTGLRISEVCSLTHDNIRVISGRSFFSFRGKRDKERVVPLTRQAERHLSDYLSAYQTSHWLFPGYTGSPIGPHAIRKYTRKMAAEYPELNGLSPHVLRHTFATMALRRGMDLARLQAILGHESIMTTRRYLHPSIEDLSAAMDVMG
jgi:site-specific recombinase XerD